MIFNTLMSILESGDPSLQPTVVSGMTKLYMVKCLGDRHAALVELMTLFFATGTDAASTQCLAYFFAVFPYVSIHNQQLISAVAVDFLVSVSANEGGWNCSGASIAARLCEWTDSLRLVSQQGAPEASPPCVHLELMRKVLDALKDDPTDKSLWHLLNGLRLFGTADDVVLQYLGSVCDGLFKSAPDNRAFTALKKVSQFLDNLVKES